MLRARACSNDDLSFLMEARAGLSATIAQRSGCKGTWASGLSIASSRGYRDANEASWTQLLQSVERIVASTEPAVLVDGDGASAISRRTFERQSLPIEPRISTIVWSNQSMRAAAEMRRVCDSSAAQESVANIESSIEPRSLVMLEQLGRGPSLLSCGTFSSISSG
ncbi:isocitrate lyase/phosphoenolpyruvate mutase family protein [Bradyrhizobium sp. 144]|nr:isocitrate lyase/phosphoenolpyruvate mutase family protein [Bradyrhizobium sp. 144]